MPGETDRFAFDLTPEHPVRFTVTARELLPYIGDAVPGFFNPVLRLVGPDGREVAFADDDAFRPDPVLSVTVPAAGRYTLEIRDNLFRGREDFVYLVDVAYADGLRPPAWVPPPGDGRLSFSGTVAEPGAIAEHDVDIPAPGVYEISVTARGAGSPLDPVMTLSGPVSPLWPFGTPPVLGTWDDVTNALFVGDVAQAECDPVCRWDFPAAGRFRLSVRDRTGAGGPDYAYRLAVAPTRPDFVAYATRATLPTRNGQRTSLKVKLDRRDGFKGPVTLLENDVLRFENALIPAGSNEVTVTAVGKVRGDAFKTFDIWAAGDFGGRWECRRVVPADEVVQAFAWNHLLPRKTFYGFSCVWKSPPPRPAEWRALPPKAYADMRTGTNHVAAVDAAASPETIDAYVAERVLRSRPLVRARGRDVGRAALDALFLAGVTEVVGPDDEPLARPYVQRVMGLLQNSALDADVWVYAPSNALALASAARRRLANAGWATALLPAARLANADAVSAMRVVFVPAGVTPTAEETQALVARIRALGRILVFEGNAPKNLGIRLRPQGVCQVHEFSSGRIIAGPMAPSLTRAVTRREPFTDGLRFMRRKDANETVYFLRNDTRERISSAFSPTARLGTVTLYDPSAGTAARVETVKRNAVEIDLEPGASCILVSSPVVQNP